MYIGLCINNNDPEERGRVQVFIPHIMPSLTESLSAGEDIEITCVGDNIVDGLNSQVLDRLKLILPWAEAASPILCGSAPGLVIRDESGRAILNQSPVSEGTAYQAENNTGAPNQTEKDVFEKAKRYAGTGVLGDKVRAGFGAEASGESLGSQKACARGTFAYLGAMTNKPAFQQGSAAGHAEDFTTSGKFFRNGSSNPLTNSGLYNAGQTIGSSTSFKPQIGDVVARGEHIQVFNGRVWVSDFTQRGLGGVGNDGVLYRMNDKGLEAVKKTSPGLFDQASIEQNAGKTQEQKALTTTDSSGRPAAAEAGPQATKNPLETSQLPDSAAQGVPSQGQLSNNILNNGKQVNPLSFRDDVYNYILATNPSFLRNMPPGASEIGLLQEGVNGVTREQAARSVADVIAKTGGIEAGFGISSSNTKDPGGSFGILQFSAAHANQFYGKRAGVNVTPELLNSDPGIGSRTAVGMLQFLSNKNASIYNGPGRKGFGGIFAARTMDLLAANKNLTLEQSLAAGVELKDYKNLTKIGGPNSQYTNTAETINQLSNQTNIIMNPDKGGRTPIINTNNMPKGLFTYPAVGAMLWVFFREGNPLFPVYFAASYSKNEWAGAYGNSSPAVGNPGETNPPGVATQSTTFNSGAGGFKTEQVIDQNDITKNRTNFTLFGPGTNQLTFTDGGAYFYFRDYLRHQVEGPLYESVLGTHESWIQGDSNSVFLGARKIITGTLTKESIDAAQELQKLMNEIQAPLSKPV
jgi:hypothetical protein